LRIPWDEPFHSQIYTEEIRQEAFHPLRELEETEQEQTLQEKVQEEVTETPQLAQKETSV